VEQVLEGKMKIDGRLFVVFITALSSIPGACATTIGRRGTSASISGDSSVQGTLAADNNGARSEASKVFH
jgi:hypothetical protein